VNLQESAIRDPKYAPGAGGWPTVRYFNQETGYDGKPYEKKTQQSMCDELGDMEYMRAYVTEKSIPPCSVDPPHDHCDERQLGYVDKWKAKAADDIVSEQDRLEKLKSTQANPDLLKWLHQRLSILRQLPAKSTTLEPEPQAVSHERVEL